MVQDRGVVTLTMGEAQAFCEKAAQGAGASPETARAIATSIVAAEADGQLSVGFSHFLDYLEALVAGRIDGHAEPVITSPAPALILSDAGGGAAHTGFDRAFDDLVQAAKTFGIALFSQRNAYTSGALGTFGSRLAQQGLVSFAATNGPPLLAASDSGKAVYCTNPFAFAAPVAGGPPLVIDQASSATAFVSIRRAAEAGRPIPEGWAVDAGGNATTDPNEAMKGALLAFGGTRGANIALMVEVLAAGLPGANWSLDAPSFVEGSQSPGTGLTIIAIAPGLLDDDFETRLAAQLDRLAEHGVHIPGRAKAEARARAQRGGLAMSADLYTRITAFGA